MKKIITFLITVALIAGASATDARLIHVFGGSAFSCATLSGGGCAAWWRADKGVTVTGGNVVNQVADQSGNNKFVSSNPTGPLTNTVGGFASFQYTGGSTQALHAGTTVVSGYPLEYFIVANQSGAIGANLYLIDTIGNTACYFQSNNTGTAYTLGGSGTVTTAFPTNSTIHLLNIAWGTDQSTFSLHFDGALETFTINYNAVISLNDFTLGNYGGVGFTNAWNGNIFETIVFSRLLSGADRTAVCNYLCTKYSITCTC